MPTVLKLGKYRFFFYSNEGTPTKAPHIHVRSQAMEAKFSLDTAMVVLRNSGFSDSELTDIRQIIIERHEILLGAYNDYFSY